MLSKGFLMNINGIDVGNIVVDVQIPYKIIIDSIVPLYIKEGILYNDDEQICPISEYLIPHLVYSKTFTLEPKRFLIWKPRICVVLIFEKDISVIQAETIDLFPYLVSGSCKLSPLHPNAIVLDNIVLEKFEVNDKIVERLKDIKTLQDATKYLLKEMMLSII
jgi:hypothetical protein